MKKFYIAIALILTTCLFLTGCGNKTADDKVKEQTSKVYSLNADERLLASSNAKNFYNMEFINANHLKGQFLLCNPTDSNFNGYVTCNGMLPIPNGTYKEVTMYCGYKPDLVDCSKTDTVK